MKLFALTAFAAVALTASAVSAQTAPANQGPAIPGICVVDAQRAVLTSTAGQAVNARMRELTQEVQGEIAPYFQAVETGLATLRQSAPTLSEEERNNQARALQQRYEEAQQLEQTRQNELRYTLSEQLKVIGAAADPLMTALYQERGCGILLNAEGVIEVNRSMDLTDALIERLNRQLPGSRSFNRLPVPVQQPQQQ